MCKVFTGILPCAILPALSQHISWASKVSERGIFGNQYCLGCLQRDIPETLFGTDDFEVLSQILPMLTGQNFFQALSTNMVESMLLGLAQDLEDDIEYVYL